MFELEHFCNIFQVASVSSVVGSLGKGKGYYSLRYVRDVHGKTRCPAHGSWASWSFEGS